MTAYALAQIIVVKGGPSWADKVLAFATVATTLVAAAAAIIGLRSLKSSREDAEATRQQDRRNIRSTRAIRYLERYNARGHIPARARLYEFFMNVAESSKDRRIEEWKDMDYSEQVSTVEGVNFWEELAGMYNRDLVNREIVDDYFGPEAEFIWQRILWFVLYLRSVGDRDTMVEFQTMVVAVRENRSVEGKQIVDGPIENPALPVNPPVPPEPHLPNPTQE